MSRMTKAEVLAWLPSHWHLPMDEIKRITQRTQPTISHYARTLNLPYHIAPLANYDGQRFGRVTIVRRINALKCICKCDCGTVFETYLHDVKCGGTKSCGCYRKEVCSAVGKQRLGWRKANK